MSRIHFTPVDLCRVRVAPGPALRWELLFSLQVLATRGGDAPVCAWRRHVIATVPHGQLRLLIDLARRDGLRDRVLEGWSARERQASLRGYGAKALAPYWSSLHAAVAGDRSLRADAYAAGGLDLLLSGLHRLVRWRSPVLETLETSERCTAARASEPRGSGGEIALGGRGLTLQPSYFCPTPTISCESAPEPTLIYPIVRPPTGLAIEDPRAGSACITLVGRTRAAALAATLTGCTTSGLARACSVSMSTASHQASVLRAAGLVRTRRAGGSVVHEITDLGRQLLAHASEPPQRHESAV